MCGHYKEAHDEHRIPKLQPSQNYIQINVNTGRTTVPSALEILKKEKLA